MGLKFGGVPNLRCVGQYWYKIPNKGISLGWQGFQWMKCFSFGDERISALTSSFWEFLAQDEFYDLIIQISLLDFHDFETLTFFCVLGFAFY